MARALVTGASSGLGLELAKLLDEQGHEVVVVARSTSTLEELASTLRRPTVIAADLATAEGRRVVTDVVDSVDILVNNAGFGECGHFAQIDEARSVSMVELNCEAVVSLTRHYLPAMIERGSGKVMNVASTAAFQPGPTMAVYYASKAFVLSFTEAVAEETRGSGVTLTAFCPGAFASGFQDAAHAGNTRLIKGRSLPTSADLARVGLAAMDRGDVVHVPGLANKVTAVSSRFTPRPLMRRIVRYIQDEA
jgi:short-subunit dehydrogenase